MAAASSGSPERKDFTDWVLLLPTGRTHCYGKPKDFPDWALLRPTGRTHCYADAAAAAEAVDNDPTAVAVDTSNDRLGYFSFTLSPPPKVSYLELHWPYGIPKVPSDLPALPHFVSVDENLLLIRIDQLPGGTDWFVYTAFTSSPPSLRRLPECNKQLKGLAGRSRFLQLDTDVGILRCGDDEESYYVVADLAVSCKASGDINTGHDSNNPPLAVLCTFSSKTGEWTVKEMLALQLGDEDLFPVLWYCDTVVPFAGRYLCWVDYYSGLLIGDFSNKDSPRLSYLPFPAGGKQYSDEARVERNFPEAFRRVAVSQGMMRFIHIGDYYLRGTGGPCRTSGLTITIWNLKMMDNSGYWDVHRVINLDDLWAHCSYQACSLPHCLPEFPLLIKNDMDVLCCVLREKKYDGKAWIIMLDMKRTMLLSSTPYTIEEIEDGDIVRRYDIASHLMGPPLIPSDFSKYLKNTPGLQWDDNKMEVDPSTGTKTISFGSFEFYY